MPDSVGTSRVHTKYATSPAGELRSSMPSMVPISRQVRLPSTIVRACPTLTSQTDDVPAIWLPTTLPTAPIANANTIEATATAIDEIVLAPTTRPRWGTWVNVVRPVR